MTKAIKKLREQLRITGKCPVCREEFVEDLDPRAVALRFKARAKRSRAAKKGWESRRRSGSACSEEGYCAFHDTCHYEY